MTFSPGSIVHSDILTVFVARTPGGPITDRLFICTGIAEFVANATQDNVVGRDNLQFAVPGEDTQNPLVFDGDIINVVAIASLASIDTNSSDTALWAVDSVDTFLSDPENRQVFLNIAIAVKGGHAKQVHLYRVAYQATIQVGPAISSGLLHSRE